MAFSGGYRRAFSVFVLSATLGVAGGSLEAADAVQSDQSTTPGSTTSSRDSKPKQKLTLALASPTPIVSGTLVTLSGTAPKSLNGKRMKLYRRVGGGEWIKVGGARIGGGTFSVQAIATGEETNSWQAVAKIKKGRKGHKHKKTYISGVVGHQLYSWYALTTSNAVDGSYDMDSGRVDIGGETFLNAVYVNDYYPGEGYWAEWNLSYKCLQFASAYGLDNDSQSGSSASFSYALDGVSSPLENKGLGPASRTTVDVATRLRLRLGTSVLSDGLEYVYPAFAAPQVLCSSNPF